MINRVLLYNSGGGIGDAIQILPLIDTLKSELKNAKFYYLSAHENHFNSTLKDFKSEINSLNLQIEYYGFRWWHAMIIKKRINLFIEKRINLFIKFGINLFKKHDFNIKLNIKFIFQK